MNGLIFNSAEYLEVPSEGNGNFEGLIAIREKKLMSYIFRCLNYEFNLGVAYGNFEFNFLVVYGKCHMQLNWRFKSRPPDTASAAVLLEVKVSLCSTARKQSQQSSAGSGLPT